MSKAPQFLIGCDPEIFVKDRKTGKHVTAYNLVPGDKANPHKVKDGAIQVDGMALEFNIDPVPSNDFEKFNDNVIAVMQQMREALPADVGFDIVPSVQFDKDYYDNHVPESAKELGCDPDFCAYSEDPMAPNVRPNGDSGLRSAAGHIHIGWAKDIPVDNEDHVEICRGFIRNMDVFVGLAMLLIDGDARRRSLYGKAGAYRPKSYGVEYRTPSNAWLVNKAARRFIHSQTQAAISDMMKGENCAFKRIEAGYGANYVQSIINNGDVAGAKSLLVGYLNLSIPEGIEKLREVAKAA